MLKPRRVKQTISLKDRLASFAKTLRNEATRLAGRLPNIQIIKHEAIPRCGHYEVCFADGRPSRFFYFDEIADRRLRPDLTTMGQALEQAEAFARVERDR